MSNYPAPAWPENTRRVLLVRLRSIGDTVLMTPCLTALKNWLPGLEIDVVVESLSAPILRAHPAVSRLFVLPDARSQTGKLRVRWQIIRALRARHYDLAVNLHGGTTATFITRLAGARKSIGYLAGQYTWLLSTRAPAPEIIWQKPQIHCVEQQLALIKWAGLSVTTPPPLSLNVEPGAAKAIDARLTDAGISGSFAIVHPSAAFPSKQWEAERFARAIEHLQSRYRMPAIVVVGPGEVAVGEAVARASNRSVISFNDLDLAHLMALISRAQLFLGNDSGPAHIAAAFGKPLVVIFGSSNAQVWHPWSHSPYRLLRAEMPCAPCPGYRCGQFPEPECIKRVSVDDVNHALDELLAVC